MSTLIEMLVAVEVKTLALRMLVQIGYYCDAEVFRSLIYKYLKKFKIESPVQEYLWS